MLRVQRIWDNVVGFVRQKIHRLYGKGRLFRFQAYIQIAWSFFAPPSLYTVNEEHNETREYCDAPYSPANSWANDTAIGLLDKYGSRIKIRGKTMSAHLESPSVTTA
jgi:hypothetical protein